MAPSFGDPPGFTRSTQAIAVIDVVESVRLMEQDEQEFIRRWQQFVAFVQQRLPLESGRLRKSLGDGLMLEFADPVGCIRAARAMQAWFARANQGLAPEDQVHLRIGTHMAEFVADDHDIYGTDVNLAARIASLAGPGEIVVSAGLREFLGAGLQAELEDLGSCHVKHVKEPVHAYRLGHAGSAPVMPLRRLASHTLRPTLAVLPFGVQGDWDGTTDGEALADDIVCALSNSEQLQVVSRLSTAHFDQQASLPEVRRQVGAHFVLTGRARRHGGRLSLFVELADAPTGHVAWAQSFHGPMREAELVDGRLMRDIVTAVHAGVIAHEVERARGQVYPAVEGHTLLLASIGLMHWLSATDTEPARAMLEHLVEGWRSHSAPHAWLSHLHVLKLLQGGTESDARVARARAAEAVRCDPGSAVALALHGHAQVHAGGQLAAAEELYEQALAAGAGDTLPLLLSAELHALLGEGRSAREAALRAHEGVLLEPMRFLYDSIAAQALVVAGEAAKAVALAQRAVQRTPHFLPALCTLAVAQVLSGDRAGGSRTVRRLLERAPGFTLARYLATTPCAPQVAQLLGDALRQAGLAQE